VARAEAYLHAKFHLDLSNSLTTVHERYRQTDRTDRQDNDPIALGEPFYKWSPKNKPCTDRLINESFHYDLRRHFFSARVLNMWNSLPNSIVDACIVNAFKASLDKVWQCQAVKFDFTADLMGTRN